MTGNVDHRFISVRGRLLFVICHGFFNVVRIGFKKYVLGFRANVKEKIRYDIIIFDPEIQREIKALYDNVCPRKLVA